MNMYVCVCLSVALYCRPGLRSGSLCIRQVVNGDILSSAAQYKDSLVPCHVGVGGGRLTV